MKVPIGFVGAAGGPARDPDGFVVVVVGGGVVVVVVDNGVCLQEDSAKLG